MTLNESVSPKAREIHRLRIFDPGLNNRWCLYESDMTALA